MNATVYRFARGVRFKRDVDGSAILLVPEGIVSLSDTASAVLELVDGKRTPDDIAAELAERFDVPAETIAADANALLDDLVRRGYVGR